MKKLLLFLFLSILFMPFGESQNIVQVDLGGAEKVYEFEKKLTNPIHKRNGFFETYEKVNGGLILYRSADSLSAVWEKLTIQDTFGLNSIYFINGEWIGVKRVDEASISGSTYTRIAGYRFYDFNFDTQQITYRSSEFRSCNAQWPDACNISASLINIGNRFFLQFQSLTPFIAFTSLDGGLSWESIPNIKFVYQVFQNGEDYLFTDNRDSIILWRDNQFSNNIKFALPDSLNTIESLTEFNDTLQLVSTNHIYESNDDGITWNRRDTPFEISSLQIENDTYYIVSQEKLFRSNQQLKDFDLIWEFDFPNLTYKAFQVKLLNNEELLISATGVGHFYSKDRGDTWQQRSTEGLRKRGFYELKAHKDKLYGTAPHFGDMISDNGTDWDHTRISSKIISTGTYSYSAYERADSILIMRSADNINWDTCQYFKAGNIRPNWLGDDFFSIGERVFIHGYIKDIETCEFVNIFESDPINPSPIRLTSSSTGYYGDSIAYSNRWNLIRSFDFGETIDTVPLPQYFLTMLSINRRLIGSTYSGTGTSTLGTGDLYISDDWGTSWRKVPNLPSTYFRYLYFTKDGFLFENLRNGKFVMSPDGEHFIELINSQLLSISDFEFFNGYFYFTDENSGLYRIKDDEIMAELDRIKNTVSVDSPKGLDEEIVIFPNPTNGEVNIKTAAQTNLTFVKLFDQLGRLAFAEKVEVRNSETVSIQIGHLPKGIYFLQMEMEGGRVLNKKLIKH